MMNVLVFAGTKNGRELVSRLLDEGYHVVVSSMSAYGASLIGDHERLRSIYGKKTVEDISEMVINDSIDFVIDGTHPYAVEISNNLIITSRVTGVKLIRYERESVIPKDVGIRCSSMEGVIEYLENHDGNTLFTTGVNDVPTLSRRLDHKRLFVRVLPIESSVKVIKASRLIEDHVIMKHPPFLLEENLEHIDKFDIRYLVTKDSGKEGNVAEKLEALSLRSHVELIVIDRPILEYEQVCYSQEAVISAMK